VKHDVYWEGTFVRYKSELDARIRPVDSFDSMDKKKKDQIIGEDYVATAKY